MIKIIILLTIGFYIGVYFSDKFNLKFDTITYPMVEGFKWIKKTSIFGKNVTKE